MTATPMPHMPLFPAFTARSNAALSAAVDDLDGYAEAEAGRQGIADALAAASSDLLAASQARMALVDALAATAAAGKQIRNDLPTKAAKTAAAIASARETVIVLQEADRQLAESREVVLTAAPSRLMRHLHGQLEATLNEARALGLDRVHDAEDAIASAKTDQWQRYGVLTADHREIRAAQRQVSAELRGGDREYAQHYGGFADVANYAAVFPQWYDRQRRQPASTFNGEAVFDTPPWDENAPDGLWSYAVRHHNVELWVPDPEQLQAAHKAALTEAKQLEAVRQAEEDGRRLTADERNRLDEHRRLQALYQL